MGLSYSQRVALAVLPKISGMFSIAGSMWIIIEVATEKSKRRVPYHRLLLAMSTYDVLESLSSVFSTWAIPRGSPDVIWASGNSATCTAQGFLLQLTLAVPLYNAMLSIYYVLVINYSYSDAKLRSFVEPAMHLFCFAWPFGTGMYSALTGQINNANLWCWLAPLPAGCLNSWEHGTAEEGNPNPCIRGDNIWAYRFGFYFIPLWISIFLATGCTYKVYRYVYQRDKKTLRYRFPDRLSIYRALTTLSDEMKKRLAELSDSMTFRKRGTAHTEDSSVDDDNNSEHNENEDERVIDADTFKDLKMPDALSEESSSEGGNDDDSEIRDAGPRESLEIVDEVAELTSSDIGHIETSRSLEASEAFKVLAAEGVEDSTPHSLQFTMTEITPSPRATGAFESSWTSPEEMRFNLEDLAALATNEANEEANEPSVEPKRPSTITRKVSERVSERISRWKEKRERFKEEMPQTTEVFQQACFYLGVFYCTHLWSTSNRIIQAITGGGSVFPILLLHSFFDPFQGCLNFFVYQRPRYAQLRKRHPEYSRKTIIMFILRFSFMGGKDARSMRQVSQFRSGFQQSKASKIDLNISSKGSSAEVKEKLWAEN